jgi:hypothetical protein
MCEALCSLIHLNFSITSIEECVLRFIANGPDIPDKLLQARDEGRVVFFCGAGVSIAKANLPDFFELTDKVITKLRVSADSPAVKLAKVAKKIDKAVGMPGIVSADRIFSLLEREFRPEDIESEVVSALKPKRKCDLSVHRTLIDLATTKTGSVRSVRIVTTNFDRLFNQCNSELEYWLSPRLPDPSHKSGIDGIIYLHGRASKDYKSAEGDGFVLSSSDFGKAYLLNGWATQFFRSVLERYVVAFVGYSADDPPVHYLLEALRKESGKLDRVYAFQAGNSQDAVALWKHKGIEAIPYDQANKHAALWETLEAWAVRARDPDVWTKGVIDLALNGPEHLLPHERGQVAHIVSTSDGMRKFSESEPPPPADWLCVFDPHRRYAKPDYQTRRFGGLGPYVNPFDSYGLDSDVTPPRIAPDDRNAKREVPSGAWDAFALNALDRKSLEDDNLSSLKGHWATNSPRLTGRIGMLGNWIARVSNQPTALWWAAHQITLHGDIKDQIRWQLERPEHESTPEIRKAWRFLFEASFGKSDGFDSRWYGLEAQIKKDGWDSATVRQFAEISRPYLESGPDFWNELMPPNNAELKVHDLYRREVKYPDRHQRPAVPDDWVGAVTRALRQNLEIALALETEIDGFGLTTISPICREDDADKSGIVQPVGLSMHVIEFTANFERLIRLDAEKARREFAAWPIDDDTIFARLRIWASGFMEIVPSEQFESIIASISDKAFWDARHQRDLLFVLKRRWRDIPEQSRTSLEGRILGGPSKYTNETDAQFEKRSALNVLNMVHWLFGQGCALSVDPNDLKKRLGPKVPEWQENDAANTAESLESRCGFVRTETEHSNLLNVGPASILSVAQEKSGLGEEAFVEKDPFAGLVASRPALAFSALVHASKRFEYPKWAWETFLYSEARKNDRQRLVVAVAHRLAKIPTQELAGIIYAATSWLSKAAKTLATNDQSAFDCIIRRFVEVLRAQTGEGKSALIRGSRDPDWATEAINAPVGKIVDALFDDPRIKELKKDDGLPGGWSDHVQGLLSLDRDMRRHALVLMFSRIGRFDCVDTDWTADHLLSALEDVDELDSDAAWAGFLWRAQMPPAKLFARLKPGLIKLAKSRLSSSRKYANVFADLILLAWGDFAPGTKNQGITDEELRSLLTEATDVFRSAVLWQAGHWFNANDT